MTRILSFTVAVALVASAASAQTCSLTTTFAGGNSQDGNMFDLVGLNTVIITGFDINLEVGANDIEVYTCNTGTYVGNETNSAAWTLVGSAQGVPSSGTDVPTPVNFQPPLQIVLGAGMTQGFYVTATNATSNNFSYTNGSSLGAVFAADANIQFLEGVGKAYPFGGTYTPRIWNGIIYYLPTSAPEYQVNQAGASLDVDGTLSTPCAPILSSFPAGSSHTLNLNSTNVGLFWDIGLTIPEPSVPLSAGGFGTPGGQIVNLNLVAPSLTFLNLGTPFVPVSLPMVLPQIQVTAQMVVADPTLPDNLALSAVNEIISL
jgi:hypothetical protein